MSYQVAPVGTLILSQSDSSERVEIQSSDLVEGAWETISNPDYKGDGQQSVVSFSANTDLGNVEWAVAITADLSGMVIDSQDCVTTPSNVTAQGISFIIEQAAAE